MIKKIICLILGHKTVHKAYTGEKIDAVGVMGNHFTILMFKYEKTPFCTRCGHNIKHNQEINRT